MGSNKSFVMLHGRPLVEHVIDRVRELALPTILITNEPARYQSLGVIIYPDVVPGKGSLGGLYSALSYSSEQTLCVACDMPLLNPTLLRYLVTLETDCDAIVPVVSGRVQGLHAVYRRSCLKMLGNAVQQNQLRITDFLQQIQVHYVSERALHHLDPDLRSFVNVNTPEELHRLEGA
jgi:molybdopterin-guanine dinucleotide biosynthesis protein A